MNDRPNGAELLAIARETLLQELLPRLPEDAYYAARMVANAMAIARRELELGEALARQEYDELSRFYHERPNPCLPREALLQRVVEFNRQLAHDIRAGAWKGDPERRAEARELLTAITRAKLAIANPKRLGAGGGSGR